MKHFFRTNRELLWFMLFAAVTGAYFSLQFLNLQHHIIHVPLDDRIPFVPVFIIPYISWYVYVPGLMLAAYFNNRSRFLRQAATLFSGAFICIAIFAVYPSRIDFRPEAGGSGLLLALCRIIYASDQPLNVFPSLHCYETAAIFLTTFDCGAWRKYKAGCAAAAILGVLICLSTVFVKQHSVLDLASGCMLAVAAHIAVKGIFNFKERRKPANADISV